MLVQHGPAMRAIAALGSAYRTWVCGVTTRRPYIKFNNRYELNQPIHFRMVGVRFNFIGALPYIPA